MRNPLLRRGARLSVVAAIACFVSACGQDLSAPLQPAAAGQFSASVAGAVQTPLSGKASLLSIAADTLGTTALPPAAVLGLVDTGGTVVAFEWYGLATPKVGTYNIGFGSAEIAMNYDQQTGNAGSSFNGTKGTITITSVTDTYVSGSFSSSAAAEDTKTQIVVAGTFTAEIMPPTTGSAR